jgi:hypothetical protein
VIYRKIRSKLQNQLAPVSQVFCSASNFLVNLTALSIFHKSKLSEWFVFFSINVFLQSTIRTTFSENYVLSILPRKVVILRGGTLAIATNILICLYLYRIGESEFLWLIALSLLFILFQIQDICRYLLIGNTTHFVAGADLIILVSVAFIIISHGIQLINERLFIIIYSVALVISILMISLKIKLIQKTSVELTNKTIFQISSMVSNLVVFLASSSTVILLERYLSEKELISYWLIVLWLSPVAALIRLVWLKKILKHDSAEDKSNNLFSFKFIFLRSISIFIVELILLKIFFKDESTIYNLICLFFGILSFMFNASVYSNLIWLRTSGSYILNFLVITSGSLSLFLYVVISRSDVSILGIFQVVLLFSLLSPAIFSAKSKWRSFSYE